ncbi:MAG: hypothetical protein ACTSR8_00165 [Promethearchaeota archaeon]
MSAKQISKVLEIDNCKEEDLIEALYKVEFWEKISPVNDITASFSAPNVLYTKMVDELLNVGGLIKLPIEMEGELVLIDKKEDPGKGRLIEFNVRNNKDVRELEGNLRIKTISENKIKVGIFIHNFVLSSDFLNLLGKGAAEMTLRTKITKMLRNLESLCKTNNLKTLN